MSFPTIRILNPPSSGSNPSYNFQGWNGQMGIVSTSYIQSVYPFSIMLVHTNDFPLTYGMTSRGNQIYNMGNPPHRVPSSRGNVYPHMGNLYHITFSSQAFPSRKIPLQPFMNQLGGGYYPIEKGHGVYQNPPYPTVSQIQYFLGTWCRTPQPRLHFLATLNFPDLLRLMNDHVCHDPAWPPIYSKLPSKILKFEGKSGEDIGNHVTTFHLWFSSNSLNYDSVCLRQFQRTLIGVAAKWYIELPWGTYRTFHELALVFLNHFQLLGHYDAGTEHLSTFCEDKATHILDHIQEWHRRKQLIKANIPPEFLLEQLFKSLLLYISKDVSTSGVTTEEEAIFKTQQLDLIYAQSGILYEVIPDAPRSSNDPRQKLGPHANGIIVSTNAKSPYQVTNQLKIWSLN
jgi:hypothetical protein